MRDILKLTDADIPIQKRYDAFLIWCNEHPSSVSEIIAEQLGVNSSIIDVYLLLGDLEEEFDIIDQKKIDVDFLFLIVRCDKYLRMKIYNNSEVILSNDQPVNALRTFIDKETVPDFATLIQQVSPAAWGSIAKYLKDRGITSGRLSISFRSMLVMATRHRKAGKEISEKMADWIILAMTRDKEKGFNVFLNDGLKKKLPEDYKIFETIFSQIENVTSKKET